MTKFKEEKKDISSWMRYGLMWFIVIMAICFALNAMGILGTTIWKRKVFVESHQYQESRKTEVGTYNATLAEIERQLQNPELTEKERADLEGQAASTRIMLNVARSK